MDHHPVIAYLSVQKEKMIGKIYSGSQTQAPDIWNENHNQDGQSIRIDDS